MRLWLKIKILSKYGSQRAFALACNRSDDWISKIIVGRKDPDETEKKMIAAKLGIDYQEELFINQTR
ncbi:MAG: hypothetical protein JXD19_07450 [Deltaproteobacteria bacterium]|nr:hypothetical protein [Deltaproteobacteria bacterium]